MTAHYFRVALWPRVLTSTEKSALELCLRVVDEEREGERFSASAADVDRSAGALFAFVQKVLWLQKHRHGAGNESLLIDLWEIQALAFTAAAAVCPGGRRRAKELQLEASRGEPLTLCVGDLRPTRLPDLRDVLDPTGEVEEYKIPTIAFNTRGTGCLAICADSKQLQRPSPPAQMVRGMQKRDDGAP